MDLGHKPVLGLVKAHYIIILLKHLHNQDTLQTPLAAVV